MDSSNTPTTNQTPASSTNQPGLIAGHAEYVKGVAESTIGSITGSQAWTSSGEQDKAHAVSQMREAAEKRDPAAQGYGKLEETAGKLAGCEGMKEEGALSSKKEG